MKADEIIIDLKEEPGRLIQEHEVSAQALITLHDSVQNMPNEQKTALQEAVADASPIKRPRVDAQADHLKNQSNQSFRHFSPFKSYEPRSLNNDFSLDQIESMNKNYTSIKNTLKQPTARRWAYYEFFYSNIDRALLLGSNDFEQCLQQMFKDLKTRKMTRRQWSNVRRLMGKPRRFSTEFLKEERYILEEKRKKIRYLHQFKGFEVTDTSQFKNLPEEIPTPMVIGTKVTAKVPNYFDEDGLNLFTGSVDAVDNTNNTYRISFHREGIGSHSIPDTDVASEEFEAMNLQLFMVKERPKIAGAHSPEAMIRRFDRDRSSCSPSQLRLKEALNNKGSGTYGGFPVQFLLEISSLSKAIILKRQCVNKLREMNSEVELGQTFGGIKQDFQKGYAFVVLELDKLNREMNGIFERIQTFIHTEAPHMGALDQSLNVRNQCSDQALDLIEQSHYIINSDQMFSLTHKFTSLMLQINHVAENEESCSAKLSLLDQAVHEIKESLHPGNKKLFEDKVEINIAFLKTRLQNEQSSLSAFSKRTHKTETQLLPLMEPVDELSSPEEDFNEEEEEEDEDDELIEEEEVKEDEEMFSCSFVPRY